MRRIHPTRLFVLVLWGCLATFYAAPAGATGVDIILESDQGTSLLIADAAVSFYNLDSQLSYTGRTGNDGLAHISNVPPGRYRITIEGRGIATIEYRSIKGANFAQVYKLSDMTFIPSGFGIGNLSIGNSLRYLLDDADEAVEEGNKQWYDLTTFRITAFREMHVTALAQLEKIDPKKGQTALRNEHRKAIDQCNDFINSSSSVVWPARDLLLGTWTINPIPIKNTQDCGQVFQTGSMTVSKKISAGHWRGTYAFQWDTSKADPACRFKFSKSGTATVDLFVEGAKVTVKYSNTGQNTFADDTLALSGNVMSGQDATGQTVTYTRN